MAIGRLILNIYLPSVSSLKGKRKIIKSLKDKASSKFNVSIAEMDDQDKWQTATFGLVSINNSKIHIERVFREVTAFIETNYPCQIVGEETEFF